MAPAAGGTFHEEPLGIHVDHAVGFVDEEEWQPRHVVLICTVFSREERIIPG